MIVRPAALADVEEVAALERELFGADAWSDTQVADELAGPRRTAVVAVDGAGLVGYAVTVRGPDVVDLQRVAVRPSARRAGVGRRLLRAVLDGERRVLLEVSEANGGARSFYAGEGFTEVARRRRYYRDGSDALVLQRAPTR